MNSEEIKKQFRIRELVTKMAEITKEYGGFANIPAGKHIYWDYRDELQKLRQK